MKRAILAGLALLIAGAAPAQEMKSPHISVATVDWDAAAASIADRPAGTPAEAFARLNAAAGISFPGIADSSVPVFLPYDVDAFIKERAANPEPAPEKAVENADRFMRSGFRPTKFFVTGPAGYDSAFALTLSDVRELSDIRYADPVYVLLSGLAMTYELDGPPLPDGELVKSLQDEYPGIRRYLHESYIRYSFERFGVTYVAAIYCLDTRPRRKILTCRQADRVMDRFLRALKLAGGKPLDTPPVNKALELDRPADVSRDFTYFSPGFLIPNSGLKKDIGGRGDYTVYARLRFPLRNAPAFANSQSFNNWGDCDFTGRSVRPRRKDQPYACKVNGRPLVFNEAAPGNYSYPWRDNFCEHRRYFVGQCPGGEGHQGQDIRPSSCTLFNEGADRCQPYQHDVVAAHDGFILRARKQEAVYLFINTPAMHVRVRYMHMNPNQLDADGIVSGKLVREGDIIGKVGNYNRTERGTTYHLHFDMQVPTKAGWVFVNPYMTLVAAYERLIGARGTEIRDGDQVPAIAGVPPVIMNPSDQPSAADVPIVQTHASANASGKPQKAKEKPHKKRKQVRKRHKRDDG
ncbi:MAG TPA: peptidoglycan DD-metalloendopeptidase family protein [Pseudolabrys sp.]|nr:peptidoglycan DD-metalloendopeptidase family protein [Pseudolabrys sp.]